MKITHDIRVIDVQAIPEATKADTSTPLAKFLRACAQVAFDLETVKTVAPMLEKGAFSGAKDQIEAVEIELVMTGATSDMGSVLNSFVVDDACQFTTNAGLFDRQVEMANAFRILLATDEKFLMDWIRQTLPYSKPGGRENTIREVLNEYVACFMYGLSATVDFIRHGGGRTPFEIDQANRNGLTELTVDDIRTGRGVRADIPISMEPDEAEYLMSLRHSEFVEAWNLVVIEAIDQEIYTDCVSHYASMSGAIKTQRQQH